MNNSSEFSFYVFLEERKLLSIELDFRYSGEIYSNRTVNITFLKNCRPSLNNPTGFFEIYPSDFN